MSGKKLPYGIQEVPAPWLEISHADAIFSGYCSSCKKEGACEINRELRRAIGDDRMFWPDDDFTFIRTPDMRIYDKPDPVCKAYESYQLAFPGMMPAFPDAVQFLFKKPKSNKNQPP